MSKENAVQETGKRLKAHRINKRLTQKQLAEKAGISLFTVAEMEQMYRRMVFNVMVRNHDDHTKNHVFMMDKQGHWSLAPSYDLCCSYSH